MSFSSENKLEANLPIKANANINLRNNNGDSALIIAAKEGNYYAFKALIEAGAETDIKNNDGDSVFEIAEKKRKKTIHNYLKKMRVPQIHLKLKCYY